MSLPRSNGASRSRSRSPTRNDGHEDVDRLIDAARTAQERYLAGCLELFRLQDAEGRAPAAVREALVWRLDAWMIDQERQDAIAWISAEAAGNAGALLLRDRLRAMRDEFRARADEAAQIAIREADARRAGRT